MLIRYIFLLVETEVKTLSMVSKINAFTLSKKRKNTFRELRIFFSGIWGSMHYFQGSREHRPLWGAHKWESDNFTSKHHKREPRGQHFLFDIKDSNFSKLNVNNNGCFLEERRLEPSHNALQLHNT